MYNDDAVLENHHSAVADSPEGSTGVENHHSAVADSPEGSTGVVM